MRSLTLRGVKIPASTASTPVKASLSSRLGVFVDANPSGSHGVPETSSPNVQAGSDERSTNTSEVSRSPDRKRTLEGEFEKQTRQIVSTDLTLYRRERERNASSKCHTHESQ
jgi:hypothetical protein